MNKMDINLENENRIFCSSVVKREQNVTADFNSALSLLVPESPWLYMPFTHKSSLPGGKLPLNSAVSETQTTQVTWASTSEKGSSSFEFALTNSFFYWKRKSTYCYKWCKIDAKYDLAIS